MLLNVNENRIQVTHVWIDFDLIIIKSSVPRAGAQKALPYRIDFRCTCADHGVGDEPIIVQPVKLLQQSENGKSYL